MKKNRYLAWVDGVLPTLMKGVRFNWRKERCELINGGEERGRMMVYCAAGAGAGTNRRAMEEGDMGLKKKMRGGEDLFKKLNPMPRVIILLYHNILTEARLKRPQNFCGLYVVVYVLYLYESRERKEKRAMVVLDRFTGTGNPDDWIFRAEQYFAGLGFPENDWLPLPFF
ncbi:hypothetical protein H5410_016029 [Solanum commersonii]|uniref:Uncharacterized protein n=1 Tax=Solanum commersonii TaxID=4109 RepID=A0A9J5ZV48_SOLCO|nr:hypothetical protein H5410_016029 [Solanum commersonii]